MSNASPVRALLSYTAIGTPIAVLVFLMSSKFFVAWDGHAVGMQPLQSADPEFYRVLIVEDDGDERLYNWPADVVEGLEIPLTQILAPPPRIPETAPHTRKSRFAMHYLVEEAEGHRIVPTTSPRGLALAALVWIMGLFLRNMIVSGSPLQWQSRPTVLPAPLPTAGQVADNRAARSKKGPPPPKRRGKRRR